MKEVLLNWRGWVLNPEAQRKKFTETQNTKGEFLDSEAEGSREGT